jgi:hypothetical protein
MVIFDLALTGDGYRQLNECQRHNRSQNGRREAIEGSRPSGAYFDLTDFVLPIRKCWPFGCLPL